MALAGAFEVVRDPLWNNIRVDAPALRVVDSAPFQRLRYIRQLGHAFLVYPGATHSRFEHALGTYHLARRTLTLLGERDELDQTPEEHVALVRLAALLHDIGHYPFSHALEEAGLPSHEQLAAERFRDTSLRAALADTGLPDIEASLLDLILGRSANPLQGLVSGSLDLDKIEYLTRDARMCGVPYGTVDVDRLLHSLTLVSVAGEAPRIGVHEKGISALESLLFAKYQMYRNVYWHHAVRSATVMFKRVVREAIADGTLTTDGVARSTDEDLMGAVRSRPESALARRLHERRLYKRALDIAASDVPGGTWIAGRPDLTEAVEDRLASELGLGPGEVLLDFPAKPAMLAVDLPLLRRNGEVTLLDREGRSGLLGIQGVADELHDHARRLRLFVPASVAVDEAGILALAERSEEEVERLLEDDRALLG
jgi:HD superfamily phosphohydrolase